jgi:hypothetical protein
VDSHITSNLMEIRFIRNYRISLHVGHLFIQKSVLMNIIDQIIKFVEISLHTVTLSFAI